MLVDPFALELEHAHLMEIGCRDALQRLTIEEDCIIVTPFHKLANRLKELQRGKARHGSCGMGIGEAVDWVIHHRDATVRAKHVRNLRELERRLKLQQEIMRPHEALSRKLNGDEFANEMGAPETPGRMALMLERCFAPAMRIVGRRYLGAITDDLIFEGAQGVMIDQRFGFMPYCTRSTTTPENALYLLRKMGFHGDVTTLGVLRAYYVRHGPGPFATESDWLNTRLEDDYNPVNPWQGRLRFGWFDMVLARYAIEACGGVDGLAINCLDDLDALDSPIQLCTRYEHDPIYEEMTGAEFVCRIEELAPVKIVSYGRTREDKGVPVIK
jgi:adenylosuccinate synthase